jgi:hypothetical protein
MNGQELSDLIETRWSILQQLLEIGSRQMEAIEGCRMGELMRLLSEKQSSLNRLATIAVEIRRAASDDPEKRSWDDESQRRRCRERQDECERVHLELLAIEAACETALQRSRASLQQRLDRVDAGQSAANRYARSENPSHPGARLDLSSS